MFKQLLMGNTGSTAGFHTRAVAFLILLFITTRQLLFTGFPFSMNFLDIGMQLLDPVDLKGHLVDSLFRQHTQPPLFNALVGLVLKIFPDRAVALNVFAFLYAVIGLLLVLGVYALAINLGAGRGWSLAAASIFIFWPPDILEQIFNHPPPEKWLSYDYPIMLLLLSMALFMAIFRNSGKIRWLSGFLVLSVMMVWTRPFFNSLLWFIPTALLAVWASRDHTKGERRTIYAVAILALILSVAPAAKNKVLYGWFTDSTFEGMNIASRTLFLNQASLKEDVLKGVVTPLVLIPRFSEPEVYLRYYGISGTGRGPLLGSVEKSTGSPNWNNFIMIRASREYQANTLALLKSHPLQLIKTTLNGIYIFFGFESHRYLWPLGSKPWGFWNVTFEPVRISDFGSFLNAVVVPVVFAVVFFAVMWLMYRQRRDPLSLFILFALVYTFSVSSLAELGHNNLFRKQVDPMLFAGCALWLTMFFQKRGERN